MMSLLSGMRSSHKLSSTKEKGTMHRWVRIGIIAGLGFLTGVASTAAYYIILRDNSSETVQERLAFSKEIRMLNHPQDYAARLTAGLPDTYTSANETNKGAEILWRWYNDGEGQALSKFSDTDGDQLPESVDARGMPVIFLTDEIRQDVIITPSGDSIRVALPPYFGSGVYVNSLAYRTWFWGDEEAIRAFWEEEKHLKERQQTATGPGR